MGIITKIYQYVYRTNHTCYTFCFGKRVGGGSRRHNECLILEPSEMIVIDYVDGRGRTERISDASGSTVIRHSDAQNAARVTVLQPCTFVDTSKAAAAAASPPPPPPPPRAAPLPRPPPTQPKTRLALGSDSSSAYSGSDTMANNVPEEESAVDLSGLMESVVDSDDNEEEIEEIDDDEEEEEEEEDEMSTRSSLGVRDAVRECLEKDPSERSEVDVDRLLEFTQHLSAFTNMTVSVRRELVAAMVFAVVEKAGTVVMTHGEELDSWSVIINGQVEIETMDSAKEEKRSLGLGDSFGITPTMEKLFHQGVMRTKSDDCQFVCVTQTDYYRILHQGRVSQRRHEDEEGHVVLITEQRAAHELSKDSHVVIRGTKTRLTDRLMETTSDDTTFVEDFLLTYRTFIDSPIELMERLIKWFDTDQHKRDKVTRVILLWVNNHFTDFEMHKQMVKQLEIFENKLQTHNMMGQLRMLHFACAAKARPRTITLSRPSRDEPLPFLLIGSNTCPTGNDGAVSGQGGVFVANVDPGSKAEDMGLRRGDQILEVNGHVFGKERKVKVSRVEELMKSVCHLSITVRSNLLAFHELDQHKVSRRHEDDQRDDEDDEGARRSRGKSVGSAHHEDNEEENENWLDSKSVSTTSTSTTTTTNMPTRTASPTPSSTSSSAVRSAKPTSHRSSRLNRALNRILKPRSLISVELHESHVAMEKTVQTAISQPDLTRLRQEEQRRHEASCPSFTSTPEHVLKVYKSDQSFKYLMVQRETTSRQVVLMALQEFGLNDESSSKFALCEVSVADGGFVKQRRLPDNLQNLAERIGLASRYYVKNVNSSEPLLPDDSALELMKEGQQLSLLQLESVEVATQLMVEDFNIFRHIEATEYVDDLFNLHSDLGTPNLSMFSELVNREMMWTVTEVVRESNVSKRMRIIKQLIKVARQCRETQNFNSMFAIVSGLGHRSVSRLRHTWEKLPSKYSDMFNEMQQLMDPSRNMSRYRNLVSNEDTQPPIIPFWPIVKKDLTFIHIANDSVVDGLVNFDKLRMIAKEIRSLRSMCSAPLDLFSMLELGGQSPSKAMVALNQLNTVSEHKSSHPRRKMANSSGNVSANPKKMFEEAQMVRRVKAYLNNMNVIMDENKLHTMSLQCEPSLQVCNPSTILINKSTNQQTESAARASSPSPSARSSTSSTTSSSTTQSQLSVIQAPKSSSKSLQILTKADSDPVRSSKGTKTAICSARPLTSRALDEHNKLRSRKNGSVTSADSGLVILEPEEELARALRDPGRRPRPADPHGVQRLQEEGQRLAEGLVWESLPALRLRLSHELFRERSSLAPPRPPKAHRRSLAPSFILHQDGHDSDDTQVSAV